MTADAIGGVWQYAIGLARDLTCAGWTVDMALLGPGPSPAQRAAAASSGATLIETGLPLDWLARTPRAVISAADAVATLARVRRADVVQLNQPALAVADFVMPVVAVVHSCVASWWEAVENAPLPADLAWQTDLVARGLVRAEAVVCPSRAFAATVARLYDLPRAPIAIHNGRAAPAAPAATGPLHDVAFTAGRLWDRGKNVATLDRAAAALAIPFKAAGAARGPHGEAITLRNLHPLGHVSDPMVAGHLSHRPIFATAARYEPFGLAVLEAALAGCALVLSDIPTFRELWDGVATFVPAEDADGFARAIGDFAADRDLRTARGMLARRRALDYSPADTAAAMIALFAQVAGQRGRVAA
ncbi:glycosyl transferase family 1 [Sphingomonas endophytica]|uniref:Glycosyl transferase family 1 n=2 Tax=Sphingomonas endophytica TaxID=869719 RepID=A0A147I4D3_9SPHN|nr:glycosyl transferase family 1 [Sphingomonas endophytica]